MEFIKQKFGKQVGLKSEVTDEKLEATLRLIDFLIEKGIKVTAIALGDKVEDINIKLGAKGEIYMRRTAIKPSFGLPAFLMPYHDELSEIATMVLSASDISFIEDLLEEICQLCPTSALVSVDRFASLRIDVVGYIPLSLRNIPLDADVDDLIVSYKDLHSSILPSRCRHKAIRFKEDIPFKPFSVVIGSKCNHNVITYP